MEVDEQLNMGVSFASLTKKDSYKRLYGNSGIYGQPHETASLVEGNFRGLMWLLVKLQFGMQKILSKLEKNEEDSELDSAAFFYIRKRAESVRRFGKRAETRKVEINRMSRKPPTDHEDGEGDDVPGPPKAKKATKQPKPVEKKKASPQPPQVPEVVMSGGDEKKTPLPSAILGSFDDLGGNSELTPESLIVEFGRIVGQLANGDDEANDSWNRGIDRRVRFLNLSVVDCLTKTTTYSLHIQGTSREKPRSAKTGERAV